MSAEMSNIGHKTMYFVTQYTAICIPECERGQLVGEARNGGDKRFRLPPLYPGTLPDPPSLPSIGRHCDRPPMGRQPVARAGEVG